ncbi:MAG: hypothetical protein IPJ30_06730 [Acidobacteria bacterium]|nr:hypothetical protein [Acidobacteriota bacterium]
MIRSSVTSAIPIYNEGLRIQPIRALGVIRGFVDLLRVGRGLGQAISARRLRRLGWCDIRGRRHHAGKRPLHHACRAGCGEVAGRSTKGDLFLPGEYYARRTKYARLQVFAVRNVTNDSTDSET